MSVVVLVAALHVTDGLFTAAEEQPGLDPVANAVAAIGLVQFIVFICLDIRARVCRWRRIRWLEENRCITCGYDLTGNGTGRCSECGTEIIGAQVR